jgi:CRISPR-associated Cas5-like protein
MKAIVFTLRLNSLYSIRIPFTWQSALTYPVLPPSAVIGLVANALQRYKNNKHPREYLEEVEQEVVWAGSRLLAPCIIKSYTTSAITKWEDTIGGKFTNALGRQFAYSKNLQTVVIFKNNNSITNEIAKALMTSPLTCGDSESPVIIESSLVIKEVEEITSNEIIETLFPVPFVKDIEIIDGGGQVYLMHERCLKKDEKYPLRSYIVPVKEVRGILKPTTLKVKGEKLKVYKIEDISIYLVNFLESPTITLNTKEKPVQKVKRRTKKKK